MIKSKAQEKLLKKHDKWKNKDLKKDKLAAKEYEIEVYERAKNNVFNALKRSRIDYLTLEPELMKQKILDEIQHLKNEDRQKVEASDIKRLRTKVQCDTHIDTFEYGNKWINIKIFLIIAFCVMLWIANT